MAQHVEMKQRKPATLGVVLAGRVAGVGRSTAYEAARTGELMAGVPVIKVGQRYRVATSALEAVLGIDISDFLTDADLAVDA